MISGDDLADDLRLARCGDRLAAARVYDKTCSQAWLLARCVVSEVSLAEGALHEAYQEVLRPNSEPLPLLSPRAWILSRVHDYARVAQQISIDRGLRMRPSRSASVLAATRLGLARHLARTGDSESGKGGPRS